MWIKICGITSRGDAELAIAAGADAIGFVFAESPRRVTPESVREIVSELPEAVEKIGVFVGATMDEMVAVRRIAGLTGVQLHDCRAANPQDFGTHADRTYGSLRVLHVVRYSGDPGRFALELRRLTEYSTSGRQRNAVLVDSYMAGKQGGTGHSFDWSAARDSFLHEARHLRLIAAGGLNPGNVGKAIRTLRPWGVDVSSGVESSPGKKDSTLIAAFVRAARAAEMEMMESGAEMENSERIGSI